MEVALDAGAEDVISNDDGSIEVLTAPPDFHKVQEALTKASLAPEVAEVTMRPASETVLAGDDGVRMQKLLDALESLDDVQDVYTTAALRGRRGGAAPLFVRGARRMAARAEAVGASHRLRHAHPRHLPRTQLLGRGARIPRRAHRVDRRAPAAPHRDPREPVHARDGHATAVGGPRTRARRDHHGSRRPHRLQLEPPGRTGRRVLRPREPHGRHALSEALLRLPGSAQRPGHPARGGRGRRFSRPRLRRAVSRSGSDSANASGRSRSPASSSRSPALRSPPANSPMRVQCCP